MPIISSTSKKITDIFADAIIVPYNRDRLIPTATDRAIREIVGEHFHDRAPSVPLPDGFAFCVRRTQMYITRFEHVIFVVDRGVKPIDEIVYAALIEADSEQMSDVSLALPRLDECDAHDAHAFAESHAAVCNAIAMHHKDFPNSRLRTITIAIPQTTEQICCGERIAQ